MMTENDYRNTIEFAKDKAREEGMRRGLDEGMQKGLAEGMQKGLNEGMQRGLNEGMQKGLNEGIRKGLDEGIEKGLVTAARNLKKMGMETNAIIQATGLSETVIRNL